MSFEDLVGKFIPSGIDDHSTAKWERTRSRGRGFFVWVCGVLGWGVLTGVLFAVVMWWILSSLMSLIAADVEVSFSEVLALSLVGFSIGGYFWGVKVWQIMDSRYEEHMRQGDVGRGGNQR